MGTTSDPHLVRRALTSLAVIVIALGVGAMAFRTLQALRPQPKRAAGGPPLPVVRVETIHRGDRQEVIRGYGVARTIRQARVNAEVAGVVRAISSRLRAGMGVAPPPKAGNGGEDAAGAPAPEAEPLITLDARDLEDGIARLRAERSQFLAEAERNVSQIRNLNDQLDLAEQRVARARAELARIEKLVPDTLAESELDRQRLAVFALEQIRAELLTRRDQAAADAKLIEARIGALDVRERQAGRDLTRTKVFAPFAGRVVGRYVEVGNRVAPGTPLFDLLDLAHVEVGVSLPASRYGQVHAAAGPDRPGSRVTLRLRADEEPVWEGPISRVDARIDSDARMFKVYVEIDGSGGPPRIAPGANVIADVEGELYTDVLAIPREAFMGEIVYVVEPAQRAARSEAPGGGNPEDAAETTYVARMRRPAIVRVLPGLVLVTPDESGIRAGDQVVVSNLEDIADGSALKAVPSTSEAAATDGP